MLRVTTPENHDNLPSYVWVLHSVCSPQHKASTRCRMGDPEPAMHRSSPALSHIHGVTIGWLKVSNHYAIIASPYIFFPTWSLLLNLHSFWYNTFAISTSFSRSQTILVTDSLSFSPLIYPHSTSVIHSHVNPEGTQVGVIAPQVIFIPVTLSFVSCLISKSLSP